MSEEDPANPGWSQRIPNKRIRAMIKQPQLTNFLRKRRLKLFGAPKMLYLRKPTHGKRRRGRPKTTRRDVIQRDLTLLDTGWSVEEAEVAAHDRTIWKFFTSQAANADNA